MLEHPTSCLDKQRYKSLKLVFKPSILGKKHFWNDFERLLVKPLRFFRFSWLPLFHDQLKTLPCFFHWGRRGVLPMMASTERLRPKRVPFTDFRYIMKGQEFHYFE